MNLTKQESAFIDRRKKLAGSWPIVGSICLAAVFLFIGWLWVTKPLLINPWAVFSALEANSIPESSIALMAALLPIVMLACLFTLVFSLALYFAVFLNERKLLGIIARLDSVETHSDDVS